MQAAEFVTGHEVAVQPPAEGFAIEALGAIDVRDGNCDDFEFQVNGFHGALLWVSTVRIRAEAGRRLDCTMVSVDTLVHSTAMDEARLL